MFGAVLSLWREDLMRRREFIATLGGAMAWPLAANAQQHVVKRIGWLTTAPHPYLRAFRRGLSLAGYVEGQDVEIVTRYAEGQSERLPSLAHALADVAVDIIVTSGAAALQAARREISHTRRLRHKRLCEAWSGEDAFASRRQHDGLRPRFQRGRVEMG